MKKILYILIVVSMMSIVHSAQALTVSPARLEVTGDPGTTLRGEIEIFNEQEGSRTFYTSFEDFEPSGDTGAPHFIGAENGLATWLKTDSQVTVPSGTRQIVPYTITIPEGTEPGGYFGAVFFGTGEPGEANGGQVSVGGKIGVLVLLRVAGDIEESGGLLDFLTKNNQRFFTSLPITFTYRLNNTGGDRVVPLGDIKIKNTFRLTTETLKANKKEGSVLPSSARKFEVVWGEEQIKPEDTPKLNFFQSAQAQLKEFHFGWYTAKLDLVFGTTNQAAQANYHFFVVPWQLLLIVFVVIIVVRFFGLILLRRYNRIIIARATMK